MYNTMYNIKIFLNQIEIKTEKKKNNQYNHSN